MFGEYLGSPEQSLGTTVVVCNQPPSVSFVSQVTTRTEVGYNLVISNQPLSVCFVYQVTTRTHCRRARSSAPN